MACKITLLSTAVIFGLIAPTMRVAVNLINLRESNEFIDDITVDRATLIGQANDDYPIKTILNLVATTMFVYIYICRFFQIKDGWLSMVGLVFALLFTTSDVLKVIFDINEYTLIHNICNIVLFVSIGIYQIIHIIDTVKKIKKENENESKSYCQILMKCELLYFVLITLITMTSIIMISINYLILKEKQYLFEWIAMIGINIYFWGMISFFIGDIYDLIILYDHKNETIKESQFKYKYNHNKLDIESQGQPGFERYESGMVNYKAHIHNVRV